MAPLLQNMGTRLQRYYECSDSYPAGSSDLVIMNARLVRTGLSASCVWPSVHSASNHPIVPHDRSSTHCQASWASAFPRSRLRHECAGSPNGKAESSSLALRTGRSPPVAPHPASRRRSYLQLQAGEREPEEDSHLSDQTHSQTHASRLRRRALPGSASLRSLRDGLRPHPAR
jgi:hypothetical protein